MGDRMEIVAFDRRRNTNREALGELRRKRLKDSPKVWLNMGDIFVKVQHTDSVELLEAEQERLTTRIDALRQGLKTKIERLNQLEGRKFDQGWYLKGMSPDEVDRGGILPPQGAFTPFTRIA